MVGLQAGWRLCTCTGTGTDRTKQRKALQAGSSGLLSEKERLPLRAKKESERKATAGGGPGNEHKRDERTGACAGGGG
jgi:hypothetical protein